MVLCLHMQRIILVSDEAGHGLVAKVRKREVVGRIDESRRIDCSQLIHLTTCLFLQHEQISNTRIPIHRFPTHSLLKNASCKEESVKVKSFN